MNFGGNYVSVIEIRWSGTLELETEEPTYQSLPSLLSDMLQSQEHSLRMSCIESLCHSAYWGTSSVTGYKLSHGSKSSNGACIEIVDYFKKI